MRRTGTRGGGSWQQVSWEVALDDIAGRLNDLMNRFGPETVAFGQGTGRHHYLDVLRFANALGVPNVIEPGGAQCFLPRVTVSKHMYGDFPTADYLGDTPPACVLVWGGNPVVTGPDGKVLFAAARLLKCADVTIVVDPCRSETARHCTLHLPIRPGTDAALALAFLNVIIKESLYDADFVQHWVTDFDEFSQGIEPFTPEWAAPITGLDAEVQIRRAAQLYATHRPGVLDWGMAIEQTGRPFDTCWALAALRAITGNLDIPGGDCFGAHVQHSAPVNRGAAAEALIEKRLGGDRFPFLGGRQAHIRLAHAPSLFQAMLTGKPYLVRAFLVFGNNTLTAYPNPNRVQEALLSTDLLVVSDFFRTPTAELADYILPAAAWPEVDDVVALPYIAENVLQAQQQVIQTGDCRCDEWIMGELARLLQVDFIPSNRPDQLDHRLQRTGLTFAELCERGWYIAPSQYRKYENRGFRTPSRKVELIPAVFRQISSRSVPMYQEPPETPVSRPDQAAEFPLILITGARRMHYFCSEGRALPSLRRARPEPCAEIHPATAAAYGVGEGAMVRVVTLHGEAIFRAAITEAIRSDVVSVDFGWWFPEVPTPDHGVWTSNANLLTDSEAPYDPAFGSYRLRGLLCRIERVDEKSPKKESE